jgi:hypothetical protein
MSELVANAVARQRLADTARQLGAERLARRVDEAALDDRHVLALEASVVGRNGLDAWPNDAERLLIAAHLSCSGEILLCVLAAFAERVWLESPASSDAAL